MPKIDMPKVIKQYGGVLGKGLLIMVAPGMAKGMLIEMFKREKVTVKKTSKWVNDKTRLWDTFAPDFQEALRTLTNKIGNTDWLTAEWVVGAIKDDFPAVASLFLGWEKASNWLERQVEIIKKEVS